MERKERLERMGQTERKERFGTKWNVWNGMERKERLEQMGRMEQKERF